jgi:hypothetical protein
VVARLESSVLHILKDERPERHAVADRESVGMRRGLVGTGEDVKTAEDDGGSARPVPVREGIGPPREREVHGDTDDLRKRIPWGPASQEILVPQGDLPAWRSRSGDARESESGRQNVLAEARVRVLRIKRVHEKRVAPPEAWCGKSRIEKRGHRHLRRHAESARP